MVLHEILSAQKQGKPVGIPSICSSHPWVIKTAMQMGGTLLIESTCNQVNQYGGYTGMTPVDFVRFVRSIAQENQFPFENVILGGDHLGPNVWQNEKADFALAKSERLVSDYVQAGYQKIHLDCSMRLADDPAGPLDVDLSAQRAARLAKAAEISIRNESNLPFYVIGTEVPVPGGAKEHEEGVQVTRVEDVQHTIDSIHRAFLDRGLESAWKRVLAVVVQPGVEFGDNFILDYDPEKTKKLVRFIENQPLVFEAHSTDYQTQIALENLVQNHFAILKVGPALTFAFREAVFALAMMENELFPDEQRSNLIQVLDDVMLKHPEYWQRYYHGNSQTLFRARKFSLSDRIRYYWSYPQVQDAINNMLKNLNEKSLPLSLVSQFASKQLGYIRDYHFIFTPESLITLKIQEVLHIYRTACQ